MLPMLAVFCITIAVILFAPIQTFPPPGWVDPAMYIGYFLDYRNLLTEFGQNYHSARLPFVLTGSFLYTVFMPKIAGELLVILFSWLALAGVYGVVAKFQGRFPAFFICCWLAFNPLWIATMARGYVDGPAMSFVLLALAVIASAAGNRTYRFIAGGALVALGVATHPITLILAGCGVLALLVMSWRSWRDSGIAILALGTGFALALAALGLASLALGGKFLFILADQNAITRSFKGFGSNYQFAWGEWVPMNYRVLGPVFALIVAGVTILHTRRLGGTPQVTWLGLALLLGPLAFLLYWDLVIGGAALQSSFYTGYLLPGQAFILAGAASAATRLRPGETPARWTAIILTLSGGALLAIYLAPSLWDLEASVVQFRYKWLFLFACLTLLLGAFYTLRWRLALAGLGLLFILLAVINSDTRRIFRPAGAPDFGDYLSATARVSSFVKGLGLGERRLLFWFNRESYSDSNSHLAFWTSYSLRFATTILRLNYWDSLTSAWQWDRSILGATMPGFDTAERNMLHALPAQTSIALLCRDANECDAGRDRLEELGYKPRLRGLTPVAEGGTSAFFVRVYDLDGFRP
ncbi:hypothetical protein [Bosea sp. Tri-44]|uniref:hypothetical protein n=1 Tax=Bosea sp. Tri-44 TaxID=1972137 RepID=UPI0013E9159A|nr:hypothetical protein [Bosea sp. Tri-44]